MNCSEKYIPPVELAVDAQARQVQGICQHDKSRMIHSGVGLAICRDFGVSIALSENRYSR